MTNPDEFSLIAFIAAHCHTRDDVVLGIGDDAALLQPPAGQHLAVTTDTLNSGVHFPVATPAVDVGWKALAVNLSDLAAMGAEPAWCSLSLALPRADQRWLEGFCDGFFALARAHSVSLIGGDTTCGPLSICITICGHVPAGCALRRDQARAGDDIWVSGYPGEAAAALRLWQCGQLDISAIAANQQVEQLRQRLLRPQPRVELGQQLRKTGLSRAAVDISDGLLADVGHIAARSRLQARIYADALPLSHALECIVDKTTARHCALRGGDDYEIAFTAAADQRTAISALSSELALPLTRIGRMQPGLGVVCEGETALSGIPDGYRHFLPASYSAMNDE